MAVDAQTAKETEAKGRLAGSPTGRSEPMEDSATFQAALERSRKADEGIDRDPKKYKALTGDRPTGRLHIGHYFGSLRNRVRLQMRGVPLMVLVADWQVMTDRDACDTLQDNIRQLVIDYLAAGLDPKMGTVIYRHSLVPECNELMLPFLTLVSQAELERNPTVKDEAESALLSGRIKSVNAGLLTYPVHQACDILFCKANIVPVGRDQLPHLEMTRTIARRFNNRYCKRGKNEGGKAVFPEPCALLSDAPMIRGLDGNAKMSKSLGNTVPLCATEDETAALIKKAKTDTDRVITYDEAKRPEVANLLRLVSLCTGEGCEAVAERIGDGGGGALKREVTAALNEELRPLREKRRELEKDLGYIDSVIREGSKIAREKAQKTLDEVLAAMGLGY